MSIVEVDKLKLSLHPEKPMNVVEQCRIVYEALRVGGSFVGRRDALAVYLDISSNTAYKMQRAYAESSPEMKELFRGMDAGVTTFYDRAILPEDAQREFLRNMKILVTGKDS